MEDKEFVNKIWSQNCGDSLRIIKKTIQKRGNDYLWEAEFIKYPYKILRTKSQIIKGWIVNPRIEEEEFIKKEWLQHCGDFIRVIKKTSQKKGNDYLWECEFVKYPYKILITKSRIINGTVLNPRIEEEEFINKIWFQKCCNDFIKILEKYKKDKNGIILYKCEFVKYPHIGYFRKDEIQKGKCYNVLLNKIKIGKIYKQKYGDDLIVIEKEEGDKYKCEFINYPCIVLKFKDQIIKGNCVNPNLPIYSKINFEKYLINFYKNNNRKITIEELCLNFNKAKLTILNKIYEYEVFDYIDYNWSISSIPEEEVRDYCRSINNSFLEKSTCKELDGKEIDIYSPKLKLGIEVNGDYWHSDEIVLKNKGMLSKEYDNLKYNLAKEKGIDLYFIWEHDWKGRQEVVKRYLRILINKYKNINRN